MQRTEASYVQNDQLIVEGRPFYLRGGEIHYFRLPREAWKQRLELAKEGGLNTIGSYFPWMIHEPRQGVFDFTGNEAPRSDLRGFLDLCAAVGFKVVARPGPWVNSEFRLGGIPEWLFRDHPETLSHNASGEHCPGRQAPAEGESEYRKYVRRWYEQVVPIIAEYGIDNGGPVILFQPDNELSAAWSFGLLNSLFDPTILGKYWPEWLEQTYNDLVTINARYRSNYERFTDIDAPRALVNKGPERLRGLDWMNFQRWFFSDWGATMAEWAVELGVTVPIIFNEPVAGFYGHGDHAGFGRHMIERGIQGFSACHTYSDRILDLEGAVNIALAPAITRSSPWGGPAMTVETNTNWHTPRLNRSEINWDSLLRVGFAHGLNGTVVYPYTAGWVDRAEVIDGPEYFEPSCIAIDGAPSKAYHLVRRYYRFIEGWQAEVANSRPSVDLTIGYSPSQRYLDFFGSPSALESREDDNRMSSGEAFDAEPTMKAAGGVIAEWFWGVEGVMKQETPPEAGIWSRVKELSILTTRMNLGFDMLELTNPNRAAGQGWIVVACVGCMDAAAVDFLLEHLEKGGGVVFFPTLPVLDMNEARDRRLAELAGAELAGQVRPAAGAAMDYGTRLVDFADDKQVGVNSWIYTHDFADGAKVLATYRAAPVAGVNKAGNVVVVGFDAAFTSLSALDFWRLTLRETAGIDPTVVCEGAYLNALLRRGDEAGVLTVMNVAGLSGTSEIRFKTPWRGGQTRLAPIDLAPHEARCLVVNARVAGGAVIESTTSELIPTDATRNSFEAYGAPGTPGMIAFDRPVNATIESVAGVSRTDPSHKVIEYTHGIGPITITIKQ